MAGGMSTGRGRSLAERAAAPLAAAGAAGADDERRRVHHCWVDDAPGHPGRYPGLVVEWRQAGDGGWEGLVAYVMPEVPARVRLVQRWLPASCLSPG